MRERERETPGAGVINRGESDAQGVQVHQGTPLMTVWVGWWVMPTKTKIRQCRDCGRVQAPDLVVSQRLLCRQCAIGRISVAAYALHDKAGPKYRLYLAGQIAGLSRRLEKLKAEQEQLLHAGANDLESETAPGGADEAGPSS